MIQNKINNMNKKMDTMDFHFMPISDSLWLCSEYFFWMSNFHRNYLKKHVLYSMNLYVNRRVRV